MKTATAKELLVDSIATQYDVSAYDDELIVATPFTFENGTVVEVRATIADDVVIVNDDGRVAQELEQIGLDILPKRATNTSRSWQAIQRNLPFGPAFGAEPWELAVSAEIQNFGLAVNAIAEAALRAEALKVFAPAYMPKTLSQRIIKYLASNRKTLKVIPRAKIPLHGGGAREVSFSAAERTALYVQSAPLENRNAAFDKAVGVFTSSAIGRSQRLVALEGHLDDWEAWHIEGIEKVAEVQESYDFERFAEKVIELAA